MRKTLRRTATLLTKKVVLLMTTLFMSTTIRAHDIAVENEDGVTIYYIFINKRTELFVSYQGDDYHSAVYKGSVVIPESVIYNGETYPVTGISDMAFSDCSDLTSVTIPESVTTIASGAFQECSALTAITIPLSLTSISSGVFRNCSALTAITIPESVTSIGGGAFSGCSGLTSVTLPESVTKIEDSIFNRCSGLTSVTLPESVTTMGNAVFQYCSSLTSITIPRNVTTIGSWAFAYCSSLSSITIPKNVNTIGSRVFLGCTNLTSISVAIGNKYYDSRDDCNAIISKSNKSLIAGCKSSIIPKSVTSIGSGAFSGCSTLISLTIPESVTSIGDGAFQSCTSLTSVSIPESVTSIGNYAFQGCNSLTSVMIPSKVKSIGNKAFNSDNLMTVISLIKEPFAIEGGFSDYPTFSENTFMNATLYVPEGTSGEYKATDGWMDFDNIRDGMPSGIQSAPMSQPSPSALYDLSGSRLQQKPQKGIYIQGGRVMIQR